jgi:hypothetical protein
MVKDAIRALCALALVLLIVTPATAGVLIVRTDTSKGAGPATTTSRIQLADQAARIEGGQTTIIYRKDLDTAWMIHGGSYTELNKETAHAMGGQVAAQQAQMQQQMQEALSQMPPEQRAMVEQMMKNGGAPGMPGAPASPPAAAQARTPTYRAGAKGRTVGHWTCDEYEGYVDGALVEKVCAADLSALGVTPADLAVMRDAARFFREVSREFTGAAALALPSADEATQGYPGFPVAQTRYRDGAVSGESRVTEVTRRDFDAGLFARPTLPRKDLPFGATPK